MHNSPEAGHLKSSWVFAEGTELLADSPNADVGTVSLKGFAQRPESWDVASLGPKFSGAPGLGYQDRRGGIGESAGLPHGVPTSLSLDTHSV
jgi:hypothetical protein